MFSIKKKKKKKKILPVINQMNAGNSNSNCNSGNGLLPNFGTFLSQTTTPAFPHQISSPFPLPTSQFPPIAINTPRGTTIPSTPTQIPSLPSPNILLQQLRQQPIASWNPQVPVTTLSPIFSPAATSVVTPVKEASPPPAVAVVVAKPEVSTPATTVPMQIKSPAIHSLQRNVPVVLTITNFWDFYQGSEDHVWILLPVELCKGEEDRRPKLRQEAPTPTEIRNALKASFEVAIPQKGKKLDSTEDEALPDRIVPQSSLSSVFILRKHDPWIRLKRGCQLQLRLYFYRLPSDFDADKRRPQVAREFHFTINLQSVSTPGMFTSATLPLRSKARQKKNRPEITGTHAAPVHSEQMISSLDRSPAKRSLSEDFPTVIKKQRTSLQGQMPSVATPLAPQQYSLPPRGAWEEIFRLAGVEPTTALLYAAKCERENIGFHQWFNIPDEVLCGAGFALGDIVRIGQVLNRHQQQQQQHLLQQLLFHLQRQQLPFDPLPDTKRRIDEEETAKQLLHLNTIFGGGSNGTTNSPNNKQIWSPLLAK